MIQLIKEYATHLITIVFYLALFYILCRLGSYAVAKSWHQVKNLNTKE